MEPLAPGTEDDPPIAYSSLTKQETELERLLKQKAILKNGQYDNIFELSYVNGAEHWFCKVCQCPVMGRVYQHELGRRHTMNLHANNRPTQKKSPEPEAEEPTIEIAPGEPIPPGFEGEVNRHAQIQERLDGFKVGPLIALEYLIEMQDYDTTKEPLYLCILCDKRGDPRTVLTHLASYNHISQYLQKHFPTCYRTLAPYMTKQYKRNWQTTLQKIAEAIEKKFGRLRPFSIEKEKFERDRIQYLTMICKGRHFSEHSGYTFQELVVHDELTKLYDDDKGDSQYAQSSSSWGGKPFIEKPFQKRSPSPPVVARPIKKPKASAAPIVPKPNNNSVTTPATIAPQKQATVQTGLIKPPHHTRRRSLSSVSSISSSDLSDDGNKPKRHRFKSRSPVRQARSRDLPYGRVRRQSPPKKPWERPNYSKSKDYADIRAKEKEKEKLEKFEEYKKLAKAIENDMEKTLKNHEKNPEKHPKYNDEWKLFWNRRYKELQAEGIDASKHDFKPEWIGFWGKRMFELHQEEMKNRKDALRKRLGLPEEPTPVSFRIGTSGKIIKPPTKENKPNLPMAAQPDNDPEVIVIDDKEDDKKSANRSHSPWESETPPKSLRSGSHDRSPVRMKLKDRIIPPQKSHSRERTLSRRSRSPNRLQRSRDKSLQRSPHRLRHSRDGSEPRSKDKSSVRRSKSIERQSAKRSRSRDRLSRTREPPIKSRRSYSREKERLVRDRRSRSRERRLSKESSWEHDRLLEKKREYRESSFERDLRGRERIRTVADLPWEREKIFRKEYEDYYKPPPIMRDVSRKPMVLPPVLTVPPEEDEDDGEVNIVSVLRLLTALEERLGSLGPKIIDLLAQALALEKKEPNSAETLLDSEINCVMFETVKEKLKGQLLAGLVDIVQERAFKKAIKKTASLIHIAGERKREKEQLQPKGGPVTVPGVGEVDKAAIAKQIANALVAQGKTDVTQAELEQLINAVVGMAEASKHSNKPMTTASFLEQLSGVKSATQTDKIIIPTLKSKLVEKEDITTTKSSDIVELEKLTEPLTPPSPGKASMSKMENLSDSDLQTLLQNFKDLSTDEQMNLINYLKKLELHEPERVERLRKYVNLGSNKSEREENKNVETEKKKVGRESPFANRLGSLNPMLDDTAEVKTDDEEKQEEKPPTKIHLDSEDEDYTYEDVVKAVSKNVKEKEMEDNRKIVEDSIEFDSAKPKDVDLTDAKALISSLMSSFTKSNSSINLLGLGTTSVATPTSVTNTVTSSPDFVRTLNSINVESLASIVSSVQNMSSHTQTAPRDIEPVKNRLNIDLANLNKPESPGINLNDFPFRPNMGLVPRPVGPQTLIPNRGFGPLGPTPGMRQPHSRGPGNLHEGGILGPGPIGPSKGPAGGNVGSGGSNFGGRPDRPVVQYPTKGPSPYGGNYNQNNFPPQNVSYPNVRGPRPPFNQNFGNNPRYGQQGGQFNRSSGDNYYNRW